MAKTKEEIENALAASTGLSKDKIVEVIDGLARIAYQEVESIFVLRGFGEFRLVSGEEREGINPFTGKPTVFKSPPKVQFTPDTTAEEFFRGRRGRPVEHAGAFEEEPPIPEIHLQATDAALVSSVGISKIGGSADWVQANATPICCGTSTRFCGQLDLANLNGPEMLYVFFCDRCYTPSSVYQCL